MLEADRLVIYAASEDEMNEILAREEDAHLRKAYGEMLRGSLDHPEDWGWYALWVTSVAAETEAENAASRRVLEKCGFLPAGEGREGPRFVRDSDSFGGFDDFGDPDPFL